MSKKIALFGGTFNPPHSGHIAALQALVDTLSPDLLYIMPSCIPPHKELTGACAAHRFCMARLAFSSVGCKTIFSAMELARQGKSYSIDTVNELIGAHGCDKIYMYVGSDMLFYFEKWKDFEALFSKCVLVTAPRCDEDAKSIEECCKRYKAAYGCEYILLPLSYHDISSTRLRELLSDKSENAQSVAKKYLTAPLYEYIINNEVFENNQKTDISPQSLLESIRKALPDILDESRLQHTYFVEQTAIEMARLYLPLFGYGQEYLADISTAALLHDITKQKPGDWHEEYLSQFMSDYVGYDSIYHARSGAYFALENFHVNPRVFRAIYSHTTGKADMDIFEKIIFTADFIEPSRKHDCCRALREKFLSGVEKHSQNPDMLKTVLDEIILESLENTSRHLSCCGLPLHPDSLLAAEFLRKTRKHNDKF